jgi:hypothetical protein
MRRSHTLVRTNRLVESVASKLANIKLRVSEHDRRLSKLGIDVSSVVDYGFLSLTPVAIV